MTLQELKDRIDESLKHDPSVGELEVVFTYSFLETAARIAAAGVDVVDVYGDGETERCFQLSAE